MSITNPDWTGPLPPEPEIGATKPSIAPLYGAGAPQEGVPPGFAIRYRTPRELPDNTSDYVFGFANVCPHMGCRLAKAPRELVEGENAEDSLIERFQEANADRVTYSNSDSDQAERAVCGPCRCHGTTFDLTKQGLVILGPATQNLPMLKLRTRGDEISTEWWAGPIDPRDERWGTETGEGESETDSDATGFLTFINSDARDRLTEVRGIGPALSDAIVRRREDRPWRSVEELAEIEGISIDSARKFAEWYQENQPL